MDWIFEQMYGKYAKEGKAPKNHPDRSQPKKESKKASEAKK